MPALQGTRRYIPSNRTCPVCRRQSQGGMATLNTHLVGIHTSICSAEAELAEAGNFRLIIVFVTSC